MRIRFKGRVVQCTVEHRSDVVDSYIESAYWECDGEELTEWMLADLEQTPECQDVIQEDWYDEQIGMADAWADAWKDGTYD